MAMADRHYRLLMRIAIGLTVAWVGWTIYDSYWGGDSVPGDFGYHAGSNFFADGNYQQALQSYEDALAENPEHLPALRGQAETLIMLNRESEAIAIFDALIAREPENPGFYANRGIANDRLGKHHQALADYEMALRMDPEVGEGPGWLTRFLRNQAEKPPGIIDRARYLKEQLALPKSQRLLSVPTVDEAQRPYKE